MNMDKSWLPAAVVFGALIFVAFLGNAMLSARKPADTEKQEQESVTVPPANALEKKAEDRPEPRTVPSLHQKKRIETVSYGDLQNAVDAQRPKLEERATTYCTNRYNCDVCAYYDSKIEPTNDNEVKYKISYKCALKEDELRYFYILYRGTIHVTPDSVRTVASSENILTEEQYQANPL